MERIFGSFCQESQVWGVCTDNEVQSVGGEGVDSTQVDTDLERWVRRLSKLGLDEIAFREITDDALV